MKRTSSIGFPKATSASVAPNGFNRVRYACAISLAMVFLAGATSARGQELDVPAEKVLGDKPGNMMSRYWLDQAEKAAERWETEYEARETSEQIAAYQSRLREKFLEAIGGLPERTPLEAKVTGTIRREGYRVDKVIFESQPKHFVTALLFVPEASRFKPPYPGVLVPCGHARSAKAHDGYQSVGALLAIHGMAALVFDPIDQGERSQYLGTDGWPKLWGTRAHSLLGVGSTLLGRNTARFEIWDGMRAIDYLQSRPEVDPDRIGCTGNSGGGTQTSYLMALDDRIRAAAPSCYLCGFPALLRTIGPQDAEQNVFGQLAFGMDHADYVMMRAPRPVLICAATKDFFDIGGTWETFRYAKRLYTRLGFAERVDLLENDAKHNYNATQREGVARWMSRWLLGVDQPIVEPAIELLTEKEFQCTPKGQVMLLPRARSTYDLNEEYENQLAPRRAASWKTGDRDQLLAEVRRLVGIRRLDDFPQPEVEMVESVQRRGYRIEKLLLKPEEGIVLPALRFLPEKPKSPQAVLYVHEQGKAADASPGGPIERHVQEGSVVLAVDLRGTGQTQPAGSEGKDVFTAYLLGRSYVGLRAEDVLISARYLKEQVLSGQPRGVRLVAVGHVGIPALHAAATEPGLFESVKLVRSLEAWSAVIHSPLTRLPAAQIVHGALQTYDLPDLAATLDDRLTVEQPTYPLR
ncbi:MAG: alpha/beta hydrolase family protein [Planctomycetota bacterium]|jgi:dienelactone hydrolase